MFDSNVIMTDQIHIESDITETVRLLGKFKDYN